MKTLLWSFLLGCRPAPGQLPPPAAAALAQPDLEGEAVYRGRVQVRGPDPEPARFGYVRYVEDGVSVHLTRDADGQPVVLHRAEHDGIALRRLDEVHGQRGLAGTLTVDADHTAVFDVTVDGRRRQRVERGHDPVVVGPTLFAFALAHREALLAGERVPFRFAALADLRTYRFALELDRAEGDLLVFGMRARSAIVRLAVPDMALTFDARTLAPARFEGLVPPLLVERGGLRPLDARVDYTMLAEVYR